MLNIDDSDNSTISGEYLETQSCKSGGAILQHVPSPKNANTNLAETIKLANHIEPEIKLEDQPIIASVYNKEIILEIPKPLPIPNPEKPITIEENPQPIIETSIIEEMPLKRDSISVLKEKLLKKTKKYVNNANNANGDANTSNSDKK